MFDQAVTGEQSMSFGVMCKVCGWPKRVSDHAEGAGKETNPDADCLCDRSQRPLPVDEMLMEEQAKEEE